MRFLVDNALSPEVAHGLCAAGHDAIHVRDVHLESKADLVIFERAAEDDRIVVSADTDFGTLIALREEIKPSIVLFRGATPRRPSEQVKYYSRTCQRWKATCSRGRSWSSSRLG